jgi:hypothetical protein
LQAFLDELLQIHRVSVSSSRSPVGSCVYFQ